VGPGAPTQPARVTSSAKPSSSAAIASSNSRVHSSPASRKGRRKDLPGLTRQKLPSCRDGQNGQVTVSEKAKMSDVTSTLPSDVQLSPEVIVS